MTETPTTGRHQTVRLGKGKHHSPAHGACVMELASLLAGERFDDRPRTACPVIGAFLRAYNDSIDDARRQDLYAYAARVVGTRDGADVERARAERCLQWARERQGDRPRVLRWLRPSPWQHALDHTLGVDAAGVAAARSIPRHTAETHRLALALVDELIALGTSRRPAAVPATAEPVPAGR